MNIAIIGAGPIGCYAGYLLAKSGNKVSIYEEHADIGLPIQCTGLLTKDFDQFKIPKEKFLINILNEVEINSPKQRARINIKEYLICRRKFDQYLADMAKKAGAKISLNHSFKRKWNNGITVINNKTKKETQLPFDVIIAADGPLSKTAKAFGSYYKERNHYYGIQATVKGNFEEKTYKTFFGKKVCPDFFAWIVPESKNLARIGLASRKSPKKYFNQFIEKNNFKILDIQSGIIPIYSGKQKIQKNNFYVLGDAASFVKATTGGGIVPGMLQAKILAKSINREENYNKNITALRKRLTLHLLVRKILNKFSDKDWDLLVRIVGKKDIQKILSQNSRENLFPILVKSIIKEPRLIYFCKYLF